MAEFFADSFDGFSEEIFGAVEDEIVGGSIAEFCATETTFELGNAVETVSFFFWADDAPEVVAGDAAFSGFLHGFHVEQWGGGVFCAKVGRNAIVIAGFVAIENHKVHGENFAIFFGGVHDDFVVFGEGGKLFF